MNIRYFSGTLLTVLIIFVVNNLCSAPAFSETLGTHSAAEQAIMIDYETGTVLLEKNADDKVPTSSMSKVMTALMVFDALKQKRISLGTKFKVSEKAWRKGGSKMFVEVGDEVSVDDLLKGILVQSGNDATIVIAEGLAGNESTFVSAMNKRAKQIGMTNSNFMNASGWPNPNHYASVRDLAKMARFVISEYPEYFGYFSIKDFTYNDIKQDNRNPLLYSTDFADGMKTGHTQDGGYGLIATGEKNGRRVILVINGMRDSKIRANEGARLLRWGLEGFKNIKLFSENESVTEIDTVFGNLKTVSAAVPYPVNITVPIDENDSIDIKAVYKSPLIAPIKQGEEIGSLEIKIMGQKQAEIPLIAQISVDKLSSFKLPFAKASLFIKSRITEMAGQTE